MQWGIWTVVSGSDTGHLEHWFSTLQGVILYDSLELATEYADRYTALAATANLNADFRTTISYTALPYLDSVA